MVQNTSWNIVTHGLLISGWSRKFAAIEVLRPNDHIIVAVPFQNCKISAVLYVSRKILVGFIDTCHSLWPPIDIIATRPHFSVCTHLLGKDNDHWGNYKRTNRTSERVASELEKKWSRGRFIIRTTLTSYPVDRQSVWTWMVDYQPKLDGKGARQEGSKSRRNKKASEKESKVEGTS